VLATLELALELARVLAPVSAKELVPAWGVQHNTSPRNCCNPSRPCLRAMHASLLGTAVDLASLQNICANKCLAVESVLVLVQV